MKIKLTCNFIVIFSFYILFVLFNLQVDAQTNVVTQHNNLDRTGWNNTETILNTKNVKPGFFGKLYTRAVDDQIYAQLLIVKNVAIPSIGNKNIVFAATVNNSIYAFDADSANVTSPYWQINLTVPGLRPVKNSDMTGACGGNYKDFSGNMGIVGTPVIDTISNTLYVVARSCASNGTGFVQYLHAIDIRTGNEKANSPILITAQVTGTGAGSSGGILTFNPQKQNQRSGLLLLNGIVYIAFSSHCDWGPYHGWLLGYDATTLTQTNVYNNTPDGYNGGIWMSGGGPSADAAGNIYIASGNGSVGTSGNPSDLRNRSETAEKLTPSGSGFTIPTFFTPKNYTTLEGGDLDFGVTQMMLIPNTNQVIVSCKDGKIYLLDRDNMGGYNAGTNNVVQTIDLGSNAHLHSSLTYYKGTQKEFVYSWSENTLLKAYPYNRTTNNFDLANTINGNAQGPIGNSGAFLTVSSNGSVDSTAILWTSFAANGDANQSVRPGILHAFDANDVTKELWNSSQDPADNPGNYAKFNNPTVANGKVYLPTFSNKFAVYGLTGSADTCNSTDIALNKPAFASSSENGTNTPDKAFDGNATTRWASQQNIDPQYIYVDLGKSYDLCGVLLQWEVALGKNFTIDVSDDASAWTTLATKTNNTSFTNFIPLQGSGRYVRMYGTARGTTYGYSLYSFEVYGKPSAGDCAIPDSLST
ncbi:MAG: discoidin domain-containing protein, partial [Ginsengibacter sp.]